MLAASRIAPVSQPSIAHEPASEPRELFRDFSLTGSNPLVYFGLKFGRWRRAGTRGGNLRRCDDFLNEAVPAGNPRINEFLRFMLICASLPFLGLFNL